MTLAAAQANGHQENGRYGLFEDLNFMGRTQAPKAPPSDVSGSTQYSDFPHRQAEILRTLYGVALQGQVEEGEPQTLLLRLFRICERYFTAECTNRDGYIRRAKAWAEGWEKEMRGEGTTDHLYQLLQDWNSAASFLAEALVQKRLHGLAHVRKTLTKPVLDDEGRPVLDDLGEPKFSTSRMKLDAARETLEKSRFAAASLPPAQQQYFWCNVYAYKLAIDRNVDLALGVPVVDYTDVLEAYAEGTSPDRLLTKMPWAFREITARVYTSMADGQTMRDYLTINQIGQWPHDRRPPKPKKGFLGFKRRSDGDEEEEEEYEAEEQAPARQNRRFFGGRPQGRNNGRRGRR